MSLALSWLLLGASAAAILFASHFLAKSADVIAEKTGLGRSIVGVVMLATATSLPELGTGVSSIAIFDAPDLAAGDAFGSNLFNLIIIGLLDLIWRNGPILGAVSTTSVLLALLGIGVIGLAGLSVAAHHATESGSGWYVSPLSVAILAIFFLSMYLVYRQSRVTEQGLPQSEEQYGESDLLKAILTYAAAATAVVVAAVLLAKTGDTIAEEMGWEASFVGTQLLALSTSLPELATSVAALRLNAPELAITNVLGSNLFNMGFVLFVDDAVYTSGVFWRAASQVHIVTAAMGVLMTLVVVVALLARDRSSPPRRWTLEGATLVVLYVAASILVFKLA